MGPRSRTWDVSTSARCGERRCAPIDDATGAAVHTYHAASAVECAILESVLHDIPLEPPGQLDADRLQSYRIATIAFGDALECVRFHTPHLPALRISRGQLILSLPAHYARTRAWAEAAYRRCPTAQAIAYGSRRHGAHRCVMLFGHRLPTPRFDVLGDRPRAIDPGRSEVIRLARRASPPGDDRTRPAACENIRRSEGRKIGFVTPAAASS